MLTLWTIGHSTRSSDEFIALLRAHDIEALADVRRFPASRRHPQFNAAALGATLPAAGIGYFAFTDLGGRRPPRKDSHNTAWRNESFRGYADYMETDAFRAALARLVELAHEQRTAIMCAEALWWQCHRGLIADALKVQGATVLHIGNGKVEEHPYTTAGRVVDGRLSYVDESLF